MAWKNQKAKSTHILWPNDSAPVNLSYGDNVKKQKHQNKHMHEHAQSTISGGKYFYMSTILYSLYGIFWATEIMQRGTILLYKISKRQYLKCCLYLLTSQGYAIWCSPSLILWTAHTQVSNNFLIVKFCATVNLMVVFMVDFNKKQSELPLLYNLPPFLHSSPTTCT